MSRSLYFFDFKIFPFEAYITNANIYNVRYSPKKIRSIIFIYRPVALFSEDEENNLPQLKQFILGS